MQIQPPQVLTWSTIEELEIQIGAPILLATDGRTHHVTRAKGVIIWVGFSHGRRTTHRGACSSSELVESSTGSSGIAQSQDIVEEE